VRHELAEPEWAAVAGSTGLDLGASPLRPLTDTDAAADPDEAVVAAAGLALGRADVGVTLLAGTSDRGVLAQLGADDRLLGSAVRAVVAAGGEPQAVPGVRLAAAPAHRLVAETMRLVPPGGDERDLPAAPVAIDRHDALVVARSLDIDPRVALAACRRAGHDDVPPVLRALARGTSASVTLTVSTGATPVHAVRQWLLTDSGWVGLTLRGSRVVHAPRSRDELATELVALLAGAYDAARAARRRAG